MSHKTLMALCLLSILSGCASTTPRLDLTCPPLPPIPGSLAAPPIPLVPLVPENQSPVDRSLLKPGLLAPQVTTADVLENHITNADAARDSAERLTELQAWYNQLREERNR